MNPVYAITFAGELFKNDMWRKTWKGGRIILTLVLIS